MRPLVYIISFLFTGTVASQVTLSLDQVPVTQAIEAFSKESGYRFAYNPDILKNEPVSSKVNNISVEKAAESLFADHYKFKIRGTYIILLPKEVTTGKSQRTEPIRIKGAVLEEGTQKKLENVSVYEVHTLKPVLSNANGDYQIDVNLPDDIAFIAISKKNYEDTVIQVRKGTNWMVSLKRKEAVEEKVKEGSEKLMNLFSNDKVEMHAKNINLTERRWLHLALTPGISTNGFLSGQFTNKFSVNVIGGYSYALEGVELAGALNMERSYVEGVQLAGFMNINGDYTDGIQMAGMTNITLGPVKGSQLGGFSNHSGYMDGLQMAGSMNFSKGGKGSQMAGGLNVSNGTYEGLQLSGGLNYTSVLQGIQVGVVNIADSVSSGFMLGVINWTKNGLHHFELSTNDVTPYNLAFKSGVFPFYTILRAGINPHDTQIWDYGMGFGSSHHIKKRASIDFESTYHTIQALDKGYMDGFNAEIRFQTRFGYQFANHMRLLAGPVLHYLIFNPNDPEHIGFADRFGNNAFAESRNGNRIAKAWLGFEVSVRF